MESAGLVANLEVTEPVEASMPSDREYELKFTIEPRDAEKLVAHPLFASAVSGRRLLYLISTYFDTPDMVLKSEGATLRVRQSSAGTMQTLKTTGGSRIDRGEWEAESSTAEPNTEWLRSTPLGALFEPGDLGPLEPQFTVEVSRTTFPLRHEGAKIEAALDNGSIRGKGLAIPVSELELELKSGPPAALISLARHLARRVPLVLNLASKSERGFGVLDLTWGHPTSDVAADLSETKTVAAAFEAAVQGCLHSLTVNAALIEGREDVEAVHKTRIALRRLRAMLQVFRPVLVRRRVDPAERDIGWLWRRLGAARDADVLQTHLTREPKSEVDGRAVMETMVSGLRDQEHRRLKKALASERWRLLLLDLLELSIEGVEPALREDRIRPFAEARLKKKRKKLAKSAKTLSALAPEELHEVRKAAKVLRYDLEMFASVPKLGGHSKDYKLLRKQCQRLQDTLGMLNDTAAMRASVRSIFETSNQGVIAPDELRQAGMAAEAILGESPDAAEWIAKAERAAEKIAATKPF